VSDKARRHLDAEGFERAVAAGVPIEFPVDGSPRVAMFIDTVTPAVGLRLPDDGSRPDPDLEHLVARFVYRDEATWAEVLITDPDLFHDGYPLLCAIADRVQLLGMSLAAAVADALQTLGRLLQRTPGLSSDTEIGLLGELLVLHGLTCSMDPRRAIQAWCGPDAEEHDFAVPGFDIEVKTTRSDRRNHWISTLGQLTAKPARPLWFVSIQLTGAGAADGMSLPELVHNVRENADRVQLRRLLDSRLHRAGWNDALQHTLRSRWLVRSEPAAYRVDDAFPTLTHDALTDASVAMTHIPEVRYRIDLTGIDPAPQPPQLLGAAMHAARTLGGIS
jgi:hypothetical protein